MITGPIIVKKCSECSGLIDEDTLISGNTFGAVFWSDGKREAPMFPDHPWLVKCPHCLALLWIDELEKVGEVDQLVRWEEAFRSEEPFKKISPDDKTLMRFDDYITKLSEGNHSKQKELYLHIRAWWSGNDKRRDEKRRNNRRQKKKRPYAGKINLELSDKERENLEALYKLLDSSDENRRLMRAEIKRELGEFKAAEDIIKERLSDEMEHSMSIIFELIQKRNPLVAEMEFED